MKMKKKLCSLLALLCILSLTACGANSKIAADSNTPSAPQDMPTMSADSAPSAGWDAPMSEEGAFLPEPSPDAGYGGVPANAKIIYTATLSLETKEFDAASQALAALVSDVGGYFESRSVDQGRYRSMDAVVRVPAAEFRENVDRLTALLDLGDLLKTPARMLSLGQRMRCEIAAALLHGPKILFLDEPTIGLDAVSKLKVRLCGTTVLLTTHDMQDIDALCSRVLLIGKGQLLLDGDTARIRAMAGESPSTEESVADLYRRFGI